MKTTYRIDMETSHNQAPMTIDTVARGLSSVGVYRWLSVHQNDPACYGQTKRIVRETDGERMAAGPYGMVPLRDLPGWDHMAKGG